MNVLKKIFQNKGVFTNAIWYTVGSLLINAISLFSTPIFTRLMSPSDYGIVSIYTLWVSIFVIFIGMQAHGSINNALIQYGSNKLDGYISSITFMSFIFFCIVFGIVLIFSNTFSLLLNINVQLTLLMVLQSYFTFCLSILSAKFTCLQQKYRYLLQSLIIAILTIGLSIILVMSKPKGEGYLGRIYGVAIPNILIGFGCFIFLLFKGSIFLKKEYWSFCLKLTLPLILHGLSQLVLAQSDRYMISKMLGDTATGIYSFAYTLGSIISVIWAAFNNAWVPWYFKMSKEGENKKIIHAYKQYILLFMIMTIGYIYISPEFVRIMGSYEYRSGVNILPIISVSGYFIFLYSFPVNFEFYNRKTILISIGTAGAALINIGLNFILIPIFQERGAAIATLVSYILLFIFHDILSRKLLSGFQLSSKEMYSSGIIVLGMTVLYYFLAENLLARWSIVAIILIFFAGYEYRQYRNNTA